MKKADIYTYYLRVFLSGISEPLVFKVDRETLERVERNFDDQLVSFCAFSTLDGREIVVNLSCIDLINFLWEPRARDPSEAPASRVVDEEDEDETIRLHFKGRTKPCETAVEEAWRAWDLFRGLEMVEVDNAPFLSFLDEDGENACFNSRNIVFVEAPASLLARGAREVEKQDSLVQIPEPARPPRKPRRSTPRTGGGDSGAPNAMAETGKISRAARKRPRKGKGNPSRKSSIGPAP
jgi:hypothetical protein